MVRWLQQSTIASIILLVLRVYLGYGWLMSGVGKVTSEKGFNAGGFLQNAVHHPVMGMDGSAQYPLFTSFLEHIVIPMTPVINVLVPTFEIVTGILLILGLFTPIGALIGLALNFLFLFAGTVSVNPLYILIGIFIFVAGYNSGFFGADRFLKSLLSKKFFSIFNYHPEAKDKSV
ncbi:DoxX family protein [Staphylococcus delphini]|uniref:DoxX family protein n=1 Tax=Staphylococcus delphini TaxID=53344 RepID=UPI0021D16717|nr:DoxX family protein [Staphylococcus delphini]UXS29426.1 DoxX family protein [Staphylococcus delphini]UXS37077.1 DoxX family protein [Staphylococcus delphini]UXS44538.1 DoxX family protein [Staphylococcus delphini]UXV45165.1 DoxX family protein [Staphylococcus delphini]